MYIFIKITMIFNPNLTDILKIAVGLIIIISYTTPYIRSPDPQKACGQQCFDDWYAQMLSNCA